MVRREYGGLLRGLMLLVGALGVMMLAASVVYLRSDINRRQYRLQSHNDSLWVERGLFLPLGFGTYDPETADLRAAYAPVPLPEGERLQHLGTFEERGDLDRALFGILSGWARGRLQAHDVPTLDLAALYIRRLELLPGLSEEQRLELRGLRAGLAFRTGLRLIDQVTTDLELARSAFSTAIELGANEQGESAAWLVEISRHLQAYPMRRPDDLTPHVPTQAAPSRGKP